MHKDIDQEIPENRIGNYALGFMLRGIFIPRYIGRSDTDLNRRLKEHHEGYTHFTFSCAETVIQAYDTECKHYHAFNDLNEPFDNIIHPKKPDDHPEVQCFFCKA